jgi:hypothetical protein
MLWLALHYQRRVVTPKVTWADAASYAGERLPMGQELPNDLRALVYWDPLQLHHQLDRCVVLLWRPHWQRLGHA